MKKTILFILAAFILINQPCLASPWVEKDTYGEKVGGKAVFGIKNALLGWTAIFTETIKYEYHLEGKKGWEGACYGIAKSVIYTATGIVQFVTFPIPVDFPNMGEGVLHTSVEDQAAREMAKRLSPDELEQMALESEA